MLPTDGNRKTLAFLFACLAANLIMTWILHRLVSISSQFEKKLLFGDEMMALQASFSSNLPASGKRQVQVATNDSTTLLSPTITESGERQKHIQQRSDTSLSPALSSKRAYQPQSLRKPQTPTPPKANSQAVPSRHNKRNDVKQVQTRVRSGTHSMASAFSSLNDIFREKYITKNAPIFTKVHNLEDDTKFTTDPVRVRILLFEYQNKTQNFRSGPMSALSDELLNICLDGFEKSPYFEVLPSTIVPDDPAFTFVQHLETTNSIINEVWVVDMRRSFRLPQVLSLVQQTLAATGHSNNGGTPQAGAKLKLVFMDYRDKFHTTLCQASLYQIFDLIGKENVRQVKQQIVQARDWVEKDQFPRPGMISDPKPLNPCFQADYPTIHIPYTVRSDYAEAVLNSYPYYLPGAPTIHKQMIKYKDKDDDYGDSHSATVEKSAAAGTRLLPSHTIRTTDVAHFWSVREKDNSAHLRNAVTRTLLTLTRDGTAAQTTTTINSNPSPIASTRAKPLKVIAETVSISEGTGRTTVQQAYTEALLTSKIVVVAQRDGYEDHYRFFEAIVGGALVMTDPMLTLPEGYVPGENIVVYHSLDELKELTLYYLENDEERIAIATKGWKLAMGWHRTFHWMERLFFGRPLTNVTTEL